MAEEKIRLAQVIQELRDELVEAMDAGEGQRLRFELDEVKLEAQMVVTREVEGNGGVKFWLLDAGVAAKQQSSRLQKLTLTLKPKMPAGGSVRLRDER
jgi:Trypsin-co-occurring domain 2